MKTLKKRFLIFVPVLFLFLPGIVSASDRESDFQAIAEMEIKELTSKAKAALEKEYPGENWKKYQFPRFVHISDAVQTAYKISVKHPALLAKFPCYCFCEEMGHKNLAYCFLEKGAAGGKFDDHASNCNICVMQALTGFLWHKIGATEEQMKKGMKEVYGN